MSINNREDANKYYKIVNELIDEYLDKWKIRPKNLKNYLKYGGEKFERFISKNGLSNINGIRRIVKDVIDDRVSMEEDGILTFESYKIFESDEFKIKSINDCFIKGIDKATIDSEKFIADEFDTSLSHIDIVDSEKHIYTIDNWGDKPVNIMIYNIEEFNIIKNNLKEYFSYSFKSKNIDIYGIKISINDVIDSNKFNDRFNTLLSDEKIVYILTKSLEKDGVKLKFKKSDNYCYWIISEI